MALHHLLAMLQPLAETPQTEFPPGFTGDLLRRYEEGATGQSLGRLDPRAGSKLRRGRSSQPQFLGSRADVFAASGQTQTKSFADAAAAQRHAEKLTGEKIGERLPGEVRKLTAAIAGVSSS